MAKEFLKIFLSKFSSLFNLEYLRKTTNHRLLLPFYHCVSDENLVHIKHLYKIISTKQFELDLDFLLKNYTAISNTDLKTKIKLQHLQSENCFFLTFDDGLRECYDVIAPILLKKGIPATFFLNTDFIDNKDLFYRMKASILIEKINKKNLKKSELNEINKLFLSNNLKFSQSNDLLKINYNNRQILDKLACILELDFQEFLKQFSPYLTKPQIQELINKGFSIGAHSASHPYYYYLTENEQIIQTINSLNYIVNNFYVEETMFAFPFSDFGVKNSFFSKMSDFIDISFGTAAIKDDSQANHFQRIPMENSCYKNAQQCIKTEYLLFLIKKMFNKHQIFRSPL